jgi:hypothetical protein
MTSKEAFDGNSEARRTWIGPETEARALFPPKENAAEPSTRFSDSRLIDTGRSKDGERPSERSMAVLSNFRARNGNNIYFGHDTIAAQVYQNVQLF